MRLLLFDVDGTLLLSGGAAVRAMDKAFHEVFGVRGAFDGVSLGGRTDGSILEDALERANLRGLALAGASNATGAGGAGGDVTRYKAAYFRILAGEIRRPVPPDPSVPAWRRFKGVYPGVRELLDALSRRQDVFLALLTGNYEQGARIKLEHFGLSHYFSCGAFGDDSVSRPALVPVAVARARAAGCPAVAPPDVVIVGDTPLDVACAIDAGVRCVAVATGGYDRDALRQAGARTVFGTFADTDAVVACLTEPGA